ncbi:metallophosphoesterase [Paenibacillus paeoniae]|uniref:Metallophosphoesterase n=1 Tax=Paenibacillus paeoniae TaxID=2292705 RepID=A0A371PI55_9BACL|nr:metallophosphoesterase [Paenibacillus paeoniae]REK75823.1 metallophosphoesterase [Paenibacillus paeoniae]
MNLLLEWLAIAAAAAALLYIALIVPTRWLKIEQVRHSLDIGARILQISDLHVDMLRISSQKLQEAIHKSNPDYIFLTGDYTFKASCLPALDRYIGVIAAAGVPVYAVLGNHDHNFPDAKRIIDVMERHGVAVLRNKSVELPDFYLVGIDNYGTGHSRIQEAYRGVSDSGKKPVIVITHDPNIVPVLQMRFDYLLSGHLHGKQMNVPFFFSFVQKGALPAKGIYKGLHHTPNGGSYYISKGIGQAGINARFMVRSEITLHEI